MVLYLFLYSFQDRYGQCQYGVCVGHTSTQRKRHSCPSLQVKRNGSGTDLVVMFLSYYSSIRKMVITEVVKVKSTD